MGNQKSKIRESRFIRVQADWFCDCMNRVEFIVSRIHGKTLDVGYYCGTLHKALVKYLPRHNVYGLDIEGKNSEHYKVGSAEKMPFRAGEFDCIVAGELIEHLKEPEKFVKECNRALKRSGIVIITTPNRESLVNRITRSYFTPIHFSLFTKRELVGLFEK
ncbi:MAG: class I SAM-dependent methyltransferase, partial [archaeon]